MKTFFSFLLTTSLILFTACSEDTNNSGIEEQFHYDVTLSYDATTLLIDSISDCLNDSAILERIYKYDTIFIESQIKKEIMIFPSQIHSSRSNIKSIGVHSFGDTLKLELIEKEKTPNFDLYCPVWIYATLNDTLNGNYIKTFVGVYPLGRK